MAMAARRSRDRAGVASPEGLGEPEQIMETRAWRTCDDCGVLYTDAYCPRCEEMGS